MAAPFIGSEAVASGRLTPYALRSRYVAVYPDVYLPRGTEPAARTKAHAAWLWSRRAAAVAGQSAAALHRAKWVDAGRAAELLWANRRPPRGIRTWSDRYESDEVERIGGIVVTTPARTALDLACRYPLGRAVAAVDALARATGLKSADVAPTTQIPVYDEWGCLVAVLDMGWEHVKVALDYDGAHHGDPDRFKKDIRRHDAVTDLGWTDIRVTSQDTEARILDRLQRAWDRRT